jgi:hypothetical protein
MTESHVHQQSFEAYFEDYQSLKSDFDQAIHYLKFEIESLGGEVSFAVDVSEIYSFLLPETSSHRLALFELPVANSSALFERAILKQLFAQSSTLVLLAPYALEFENLLRWLRTTDFEMRADAALKLFFDEYQNLIQSPEFKQLMEMVGEARRSERALDTAELARLLLFLQEHAPSLIALTGANLQTPLEVAGQLIRSGVFQTSGSLVDDDSIDLTVFDRWYEALMRIRGNKSGVRSGIDAMAMALLSTVNRALAARRARLYLVTRSMTMHTIFQREYEQGLWSEAGYFILNPRALTILNSVSNRKEQPRRALVALEERRNQIELFLDMISGAGTKSQRQTLLREPAIQALRDKIVQDWRDTEALAISLAEVTADASTQNILSPPELMQMMDLLQHTPEARHRLLQLVVDRLDQLATRIESEQQVLGLYYQSQELLEKGHTELLQAHEYPRYHLTAESQPATKLVVRAENHAMLHTVQFYTSEAGDLLRALSREGGWQEATYRLIGPSLGAETNYEIPLLIAFVLAADAKWQYAERYALRAVEVAKSTPNAPVHEAFFFYAVCLRKADVASSDEKGAQERHLESLVYLRQAIAAKRNWMNDQDYSDPRYFKELGSQILRLNLDHGRNEDKYPPPEEGLAQLQLAEERCQSDDLLRIQILNNRLFYLIESGELTDPAEIVASCEKLRELQERVEPREAMWSPAVLDTLAWGEWLVNRDHLTDDRRLAILTRLQKALSSRDNAEADKRQVREHLHQMRVWTHQLSPRGVRSVRRNRSGRARSTFKQ